MAASIKSVFAQAAQDVKIDKHLIKRIHDYERSFVNRSEEHLAFFGGHLMGVQPLRFRPIDRSTWFTDVLQLDELSLEEEIHSLPTVNPEFKRASDVMNISCVWVAYEIQKSKLSIRDKEQGSTDAFLVMLYKFLGSLMAHYYPYPADREVMLAVYAKLSYRYALKQAGSWNKLLHNRAKELISPRSIHHRTLMTFENDKAIGDMVSDVQGRLREIVKTMTKVFYDLRAQGRTASIGTSRMVSEIDGLSVVEDKTKRYASYLRYVHDIAGDKRSFVRGEIVDIVSDAMRTMPPKLLVQTLEWMSLNHGVKRYGYIEELIDEVLLHAFNLINHHRSLYGGKGHLPALISKLRALYMASRMSDPSLLKAKALTEKIVKAATGSKNNSVIASVRTGVQLFIVIRALSKDYYAG